jgi:hypothetical protein
MRPVELNWPLADPRSSWATKAAGEPIAMGDDLQPEARKIPAA